MKTMVIKAEDTIVEKIASLFELLPEEQYEIKILPDSSEEASEEMIHPISLKRGSAKEIITYIADDFDAPLEDFKEYMP